MRKGVLIDRDMVVSPVRDTAGLIVRGMVIDRIDDQNAEHIVLAQKGEIKEFPVLGGSLINYVKSVGKEREMVRDLQIQLKADGNDNPLVTFIDGQLTISV